MTDAYDSYRAWCEYRRWQLMFAGQFGRIGWTYLADSKRGKR
jgi:hypothetical protein